MVNRCIHYIFISIYENVMLWWMIFFLSRLFSHTLKVMKYDEKKEFENHSNAESDAKSKISNFLGDRRIILFIVFVALFLDNMLLTIVGKWLLLGPLIWTYLSFSSVGIESTFCAHLHHVVNKWLKFSPLTFSNESRESKGIITGRDIFTMI